MFTSSLRSVGLNVSLVRTTGSLGGAGYEIEIQDPLRGYRGNIIKSFLRSARRSKECVYPVSTDVDELFKKGRRVCSGEWTVDCHARRQALLRRWL